MSEQADAEDPTGMNLNAYVNPTGRGVDVLDLQVLAIRDLNMAVLGMVSTGLA